MYTNHAYSAALIAAMENTIQKMQPAAKQANTKTFPCTKKDITTYVECLLDINEECILTEREQQSCDWATD